MVATHVNFLLPLFHILLSENTSFPKKADPNPIFSHSDAGEDQFSFIFYFVFPSSTKRKSNHQPKENHLRFILSFIHHVSVNLFLFAKFVKPIQFIWKLEYNSTYYQKKNIIKLNKKFQKQPNIYIYIYIYKILGSQAIPHLFSQLSYVVGYDQLSVTFT